jgi:hypothetical protein
MLNHASSLDTVNSSLAMPNDSENIVGASGQYFFECFDSEGNLKWSETVKNLVTRAGVQAMNTRFFVTSTTPAWYVGLVDGGGTAPVYSSFDVINSHTGWTEFYLYYSQANRPTCSFGTATTSSPSVISNSTGSSLAIYSITGPGSVAGAFLVSENTKNGTTGVLFSVAGFTSGIRSVANGDTLQVTYTFSLTPV